MSINQDEFLKELLNDFRQEAEEHLSSIEEGILELEKNGATPDFSVLERVYRETHSLKGAARAVNLSDTEKVCMSMENVMNTLKEGEGILFDSLFEVMQKSVDTLRLMLSNLKESGTEKKLPNLIQLLKNLNFIQKESVRRKNGTVLKDDIVEIKSRENFQINKSEIIQIPNIPVKVDLENETIRVSAYKLNNVLSQSDDFLAIKTTLSFYKKELEEIKQKINDERLDNLYGDLSRFIHVANRMVDDLIINVKSTLLLPFSTILNIVPRVVKDLSRDKGKDINIEITGEHYEIDKRILEEIKDPIIHIIRNCVDHGIENSNERIKAGKKPVGNILIQITKDADAKLSLLISDDGEGIKLDKVIKSSIKLGIISKEEASEMPDKEKVNLIFSSGVSSSELITEISGRGLGMAIVAEKISNLGGTITVDTIEGEGTSFSIKIPQTIATFRGLLVRSGENKYLIPNIFVEKVIGVGDSDIISSGNKPSVYVSGAYIGIIGLCASLGIKEAPVSTNNKKPALILSSNRKQMAFLVDEIIEEVEGIVKPLGKQLKKISKITGVTMIGNGILIPVLNVTELIESSTRAEFNELSQTTQFNGLNNKKQRILIVEDSITVRSMLKSIVENAGYETEVAVDGIDAFKKLNDGNFDAVVTDIEMPNMNGFELTSKIRNDDKLSEMPVILVTTLETPKDMQKGLESGANAYIVKGSFEKSNLTDTIRRLI
jgi:two-component system chemotaxis sensor kinase CheA